MNVIYFAWIKEKIGVSEETIALPKDVSNVTQLLTHLKARGGGYATAFENLEIIRVAVNQDHVDFEHTLHDDDEVAFFPPVTGG